MTDRSVPLARFLEIIPESAAPALLGAMTSGDFDVVTIKAALAEIDWNTHRHVVEDLLRTIVPIEALVPDVYENWRPVVCDGFAFIGARLSPERLVPKLIEQLTLPETASVEDRIIAFIRRIPSLQKIGQVVARNRNFTPEFRARLSELEDSIHEVDKEEIRLEIENQLGSILAWQQVVVEPELYAEGTVSAVVRFRRSLPWGDEPRTGVLKVLKPFITEYFPEDLALLSELADYFDTNQKKYDLDMLSLRDIIDDVRDLFEREIDFVSERASLAAAVLRFANVPGIRVPAPIFSLSTNTITAMTEERSVKAIDGFVYEQQRRRETAQRLIIGMVAVPLFSSELFSPFHADPHAGNLRVDETTGDVVVLDWALTDVLSVEQRRSLIRLVFALPLRDEGQMVEALSELTYTKAESEHALLKQQVEFFMDSLTLGQVPSLSDLVGALLRNGVRFSSSFLIFRKMLLTLADVVAQLAPDVTIEKTVAEYALVHGLNRNRGSDPRTDFNIPLNASDICRIAFGVQSWLPRVWAQSVRSVARTIIRAGQSQEIARNERQNISA